MNPPGFVVSVHAVPDIRLICFDCDSTLSAIEGVDELARAEGPATFALVEAMTNEAMGGTLPVEAVFARRLEIIRPNRSNVEHVGRRYIETIEPTALQTVRGLAARGWTPVIVSGGFRQVIRPLADALGIARVEAVDLYFNEDGTYRGFDDSFPTTRSGGKPEILKSLLAQYSATEAVMVGDGVSDLETKSVATRFIGFGRYIVRPAVRAGAAEFIHSLDELLTRL